MASEPRSQPTRPTVQAPGFIQFDLGWFGDLGPLMRKAILGPHHPKALNHFVSEYWVLYEDGKVSLGFEIPTW